MAYECCELSPFSNKLTQSSNISGGFPCRAEIA
jgi:hypothetical protein